MEVRRHCILRPGQEPEHFRGVDAIIREDNQRLVKSETPVWWQTSGTTLRLSGTAILALAHDAYPLGSVVCIIPGWNYTLYNGSENDACAVSC